MIHPIRNRTGHVGFVMSMAKRDCSTYKNKGCKEEQSDANGNTQMKAAFISAVVKAGNMNMDYWSYDSDVM